MRLLQLFLKDNHLGQEGIVSLTPEEKAKFAIHLFREVVFEVLVEVQQEGKIVGPTEISERLGIPIEFEGANGKRPWMAWVTLQLLAQDGIIIHYPRRGYELVEEEFP